MTSDSDHDPLPPVEIPIDGVLDLHMFRPAEVKTVLNDYLDACQAKGIFEVRVVHGKGIGQLRRAVHTLLSRRADVISFAPATEYYGGAGATIVRLRPQTESGSNTGS